MKTEDQASAARKLALQSSALFLVLLLAFLGITFLSAGTIRFWNAWLCYGEFFLLELFFAIYLFVKQPDLLQKRIRRNEKEKVQRYFNVFAYPLVIIAVMIIPGLDYRFRWSCIPVWLIILASIVMLLGIIAEFIIAKQNIYVSRTIEIQKNQKLIDTGFYSVIRHPMYLFGIIVFLTMPIILGSLFGFLLLAILLPILFVIRILNEEKVLEKGLEGYEEYMKRVKYRLIPHIW